MKRFALLFAALLAHAGMALAAVNINSATREQLEALDGIGPVKAQAIIDYRKKNGPFKRLEDVKNVDGVGDATYDKIRGDIALSGTTTVPKGDAAPRSGSAADKAAEKKAKADEKMTKTEAKANDKKATAEAKADAKKAKADASADEKKAKAKAAADEKKAKAKAAAEEKKAKAKAAADEKKAKADVDAKKDARKDEDKKK
jgi:competence protein ComEA